MSQTPGLDRMLQSHLKHCTFWIFSGDRHCSCGRDLAIKELDQLKSQAPVKHATRRVHQPRARRVDGAQLFLSIGLTK